MEQPQHEQIMNALLEIKGDVGEIKGQVKGINNRLDIANGSIVQHTKEIGKLKTGQTTLKTQAAMLGAFASVIIVGVIEYIKRNWG